MPRTIFKRKTYKAAVIVTAIPYDDCEVKNLEAVIDLNAVKIEQAVNSLIIDDDKQNKVKIALRLHIKG
jgi:hypothetical protein